MDYWVKLLGAWNSVVHRSSAGAIVVFVMTPAPGANEQAARQTFHEFAQKMLPYISQFLAEGPEAK